MSEKLKADLQLKYDMIDRIRVDLQLLPDSPFILALRQRALSGTAEHGNDWIERNNIHDAREETLDAVMYSLFAEATQGGSALHYQAAIKNLYAAWVLLTSPHLGVQEKGGKEKRK